MLDENVKSIQKVKRVLYCKIFKRKLFKMSKYLQMSVFA